MDAHKSSAADITALLQQYASGGEEALGDVVSLVYDELRRLAHGQLARSGERRHIDTTVLVHEAYEKLVQGKTQRFEDRAHFFAIASRAMRQLVVDSYRARNTAKRGGDLQWVTATSLDVPELTSPERLLAVNQALERLAQEDESLVALLDMACFGGLTTEQMAEVTAQTVRSVQRKLKRAQLWLSHFLADEG